MDLDCQGSLLRIARERAGEALAVVLGSPNPESAELYARTVTEGDPTYAGPLAGVPLGLPVYHVFEAEVKEAVDPEVYREQVGVMELALDAAAIARQVRAVREGTEGAAAP
jgi:glycine reductase